MCELISKVSYENYEMQPSIYTLARQGRAENHSCDDTGAALNYPTSNFRGLRSLKTTPLAQQERQFHWAGN
jgi:hypothetical protein